MNNDLEAYFIRHKFGTGNPPDPDKLKAVLKEAWDESFAVIDYQEFTDATAAFDPKSYGDWPAAKKTLNKVNHYLEDGGASCDFFKYKPPEQTSDWPPRKENQWENP